MPDYNTYFSFELELPGEEAVDYALDLATIADSLRWQPEEERKTGESDFPKELIDVVDNWSFEVCKEKAGIWIHSDSGGVDAAAQFVQHLLERFSIAEPVSFEWANSCSKPCLDAYGGGAVVITAKRIKAMTTCDWVFKQEQRIRKATAGAQVRKPA